MSGMSKELYDLLHEKYDVRLEPKTYICDEPLSLSHNERPIFLEGNGATILARHNGCALRFSGNTRIKTHLLSDYQAGAKTIQLASTLGVQPGDTLRLVSSELYCTSRPYYFLGGNVEVVGIDGNTLLLSHALPFDLKKSNTNATIYKPVVIQIQNLNIIRYKEPDSAEQYGIELVHACHSGISHVYVDKFCVGISVKNSVDCKIQNCTTGKSIFPGTPTSYGILNNSSTEINIENCNTRSGRHGIAVGGQEPVFNTFIRRCLINNESESQAALDSHENCYNMEVWDSDLYRISMNGNITLKNCRMLGKSKNLFDIGYHEDFQRANYYFINCLFHDQAIIRSISYSQQPSPTRKYIGRILIENCRGIGNISLNLQSTYSYGSIQGIVDQVIIKDSGKIRISAKDRIQHLKEA